MFKNVPERRRERQVFSDKFKFEQGYKKSMNWRLLIVLMILILAFLGVNIAFVMKLGEQHSPMEASSPTSQEQQTSQEPVADAPAEEKKELTFLEIKTEECMARQDISARDSCFISLIPLADSPELCNMVQGKNDRLRCVYDFAKKTHDYTLCEMLGSEYEPTTRYGQQLSMAQLCKDEIAYLIKDTANCWTNNCLYILAQRTKDEMLCQKIDNAAVQEECLRAVG